MSRMTSTHVPASEKAMEHSLMLLAVRLLGEEKVRPCLSKNKSSAKLLYWRSRWFRDPASWDKSLHQAQQDKLVKHPILYWVDITWTFHSTPSPKISCQIGWLSSLPFSKEGHFSYDQSAPLQGNAWVEHWKAASIDLQSAFPHSLANLFGTALSTTGAPKDNLPTLECKTDTADDSYSLILSYPSIGETRAPLKLHVQEHLAECNQRLLQLWHDTPPLDSDTSSEVPANALDLDWLQWTTTTTSEESANRKTNSTGATTKARPRPGLHLKKKRKKKKDASDNPYAAVVNDDDVPDK